MNVLVLLLLAAHPLTVDTHNDSTQKITYDHRDIGKPQPDMHLDLDRVKKGGLDAQFFSIWVPPKQFKPEQWYGEAIKQMEAIKKMAAEHPKQVALARTAADVRRNAAKGLLSALFGVEGGHALGTGPEAEQLDHLKHFGELGVRYMTLTWTNTNPIGGSSGDAGDILGLTDFGKRVIDEMHRQGIIVDISHVSDPMFWDVIRYAKKPVLASHSSARALANVPRNMTDPMIKAVARNGGAVCVNFYPRFLDQEYSEKTLPLYKDIPDDTPFLESEKLMRAKVAKANIPPVPLSKLIDHIDHMVKLVGADHVCLGSDFDGIDFVPKDMEDVSKFQNVASELKKRGYKQADIDKIMGGNVLRVMEANEARK